MLPYRTNAAPLRNGRKPVKMQSGVRNLKG